MKKRILGILFVLLLVVVMLLGCSRKKVEALGELARDVKDVVTEDKEEEEEDKDPFAIYRSTENWARANFNYCFLKKSDGYLYSMGEYAGKEMSDTDYKVGIPFEQNVDGNWILIYTDYRDIDGNWYVMSCGDYKPLLIESGDKVIQFTNDESQTLRLYNLTPYGYSLGISMDHIGYVDIFDTENRKAILLDSKPDDFEIRADDGESIDNIHYMEKGRECTVYYNGEKTKLKADCHIYYLEMNGEYDWFNREADYTVYGKLNEEGNMEFDLSGMKSGVYYTDGGGVIQIQ